MATYNPIIDPSEGIVIDETCPSLSIENIYEGASQSCEYLPSSTCVNTHTFYATLLNVTGDVDYNWHTDNGVVIGGNTSDSFTVEVKDNKDVTLNIVLSVGDSISGLTRMVQVISPHALKVLDDCILAFTDGLWIGYEVGNFGYLQVVVSNEPVHAIKWKEDILVVRIGEGGNVKLPDVDIISLKYLGREFLLIWNDIDYLYETDDPDLLEDLAVEYTSCDRVYCFSFSYLADLTIATDFTYLDTRANGERYFENSVGDMSPQFDGIAKSGCAVALNELGDIGQTVDVKLEVPWTGRYSTATYIDGGVLKYAAIDELRYEDGVALMEEAGTNRELTSSEDFSLWSQGSCTLTSGVVGPDGTTNAWNYLKPTETEIATYPGGFTVGKYVTFSIWARVTSDTLYTGFNVRRASDNLSILGMGMLLTTTWQRFYGTTPRIEDTSDLRYLLGHWGDDEEYEIFGFQVEENKFMTSYIPALNSEPAHRLGDRYNMSGNYITIASATSNVIETLANEDDVEGSSIDLITNGTFDTDISNWTTASGQATWVGGQMLVTDLTSGHNNKATQNITLEVGYTYTLKATISEADGVYNTVQVRSISGDVVIASVSNNGTHYQSFIATEVAYYLNIFSSSSGEGDSMLVDAITVRKVMPNNSVFKIHKSFYNAFTTNIPILDGDRDLMLQSPDLLTKVALGDNTLGLSFNSSDIVKYYPCSDYNNEALVADIKDPSVELCTNGTFDEGVDGITADGSINIVWYEAAKQLILWVLSSSLYNQEAKYYMTGLEIGKEYTASGTIAYAPVINSTNIYVVNGAETHNVQIKKLGTGSCTFVATDTTAYFLLTVGYHDWGTQFDNLSLRITPTVIKEYSTNCRDYLKNKNTGLQNIMFNRDEFGVPISPTDVGVIQVNELGGYVDMGLVVTSEASIQYTCTGLLEDLDEDGIGLGTYTQRTEKRILEYGGGNPTQYSIDDVVQTYTPTLPAETLLILNNIAFIGYPDIIDSVNVSDGAFKYFSQYGGII